MAQDAACNDTPPSFTPLPTFKLALGPTGDVAIGMGCRGNLPPAGPTNTNVAAYERFNGSGALLMSGYYQVAGQGAQVNLDFEIKSVSSDESFVIQPGNDLVVQIGGCMSCGIPFDPASCGGAWFEEQPANGGAPSQGNVSSCPAGLVGDYCCGLLATQASTPSGQIVATPSYPPVSDGAGGTYVSGALTATLDLGCGPMTPTGSTSGYVAHLGPTSTCIFSHVLPAVPAIVADTQGVVVSASATTSLDLGCGASSAAAGGSTFVTRLDPSGSCVFGTSLPAPGLAVALDSAGSEVVSGLVGAAPFDFGGGPLAPIGSQDFVLGKLDVAGNYRWGRRFGGAGVTFAGPWVTVVETGDVYLRTGWSGTADLGGGAITAASHDTVVARYAPSGTYVWGRDFAITGQYLAGIDACGALVVASSDPAFDPGQGTVLPQPPYTGSFIPSEAIVRYAP